MKSHAEVVVIGGGVVGCSVLYHLTKLGLKDVMLIERSELTSGSSWHAAGGIHTINGDPNVAKLQKYTVELYREIEELSGQSCGVHMTGGLMLAATPERFDWLKLVRSKGRYLDMDTRLISAEEAHEMFPLLDPSKFVGALHDEHEGHLDPSGTTYAYAKAAKANGATIELHTRVTDLVQREDGAWRVITEGGEVVAEHVVNAGGLWAREVGRMVGLELPVLAMEHMYLLTDDMPEVADYNKKTGHEMIHAVDFDGELYMRQERGGMLLGTYEKDCRPWSPKETPWSFGHELLEPDLDRIAPSLEHAFTHFPAFENAGIRQIINGPFTFAPDGNPLVGPVKGLRGFWCACGVMAGFAQGGGVGLALSNWIVNGDPGFDVFAMDVARFGDFATLAYTNAKVQENYSRRFSIRFPNEELPAARPLRTTPIYDLLAAKGAQFGTSFGLEVPLWFAPEGVEERFSWHRSTDFDHVGEEARAVREGAGILDISSFSKFEVKGDGAQGWLDRMLACRIPAPGRMVIAPMLKADGRMQGDLTLANLGDRFFLAGSGAAEDFYLRWFLAHADPDVEIRALGHGLAGLHVAGPNAREILGQVTGVDLSADAFRFMDVRETEVAMVPAILGRVSFTGDLGYEIWMAPDYQRTVYLALKKAGGQGLRDFGLRALNALRLEKNFGGWGSEYRPIYTPWEAGMDRFVALSKDADFVGKAAARETREAENGAMRLRAFRVEADGADCIGDEAIWQGGDVVGWVTSGGYAHASDVSMAMGYVPKALASREDGWEIEILGERRPAALQPQPLFDANASRMRA